MNLDDKKQSGEALPMVSCVMPTRDRNDFVRQSIRYFERQEYSNRELIIIDDSSMRREETNAKADRIRYLYSSASMSIGQKRNLGCQCARGTFIAQWDDDDWYSPQRLSAQVTPLLAGTCDITGIAGGMIFDVGRWEFWEYPPDRTVLEGTLVYHRRIWEEAEQYPNSSFGECGAFLATVVHSGATLEGLRDNKLFLYVLHGANTSTFGLTGRPYRGCTQISEPPMLESDRDFYLSLRSKLSRESGVSVNTQIRSE